MGTVVYRECKQASRTVEGLDERSMGFAPIT